MQRSLVRRQAYANRPKLPQARKAGVALAVAAFAAAAAPAKGAGPKSGTRTSSEQVEQLLHVGSRGPAIRALQRHLGITADGIFGPQTRKAVRAFQKRHGLVVDGVVGPQTRSALAAGGSEAGPRIIRAWWVRPVQRKLGVTVDGAYGPESRAAVRRYQVRHGLVVDGIVGPQTLGSLGISRGGGNGHSGGGMRIIRAWWVAPVQRKLGVPVDGEYGPITRRAVKRFQASHGLVVDGIVGPQTLAALGIRRPAGGSVGRERRAELPRVVARRDGRCRGPLGPRAPVRVGRKRSGQLRLQRPHGLGVAAGRRDASADELRAVPGRPAGLALQRPCRRSRLLRDERPRCVARRDRDFGLELHLRHDARCPRPADRRLVLGLELRRRAPRGLGDRYQAPRAGDAPGVASASDDVCEPPRGPAVEPEAGADLGPPSATGDRTERQQHAAPLDLTRALEDRGSGPERRSPAVARRAPRKGLP